MLLNQQVQYLGLLPQCMLVQAYTQPQQLQMWSYTPPKWYTRRSPLHTSKRSQRTLPHFLHNRTTIHLLAQTLIYYPVFKHATIHPSQSLDFHYIRIHFPDMKFLNFQHSNKYTRVVNMPSYKTTPSISWVFNALRAVFQLTTLL